MAIKAISFDLWNTLIKSNPNFAKARLDYLQTICSKSRNEINNILFDVKGEFDQLTMIHGIHYDSRFLWKIIIKRLEISTRSVIDIEEYCEGLFLDHYPQLYSSNTKGILESLARKYELYLLSNTMLIKGETLEEVLKKHGIYELFESRVFSDRILASKPHPKAFESLHIRTHLLASEIIHVGDNEVCDKRGAFEYGIQSYLVHGTSGQDLNTLFAYLNTFKL